MLIFLIKNHHKQLGGALITVVSQIVGLISRKLDLANPGNFWQISIFDKLDYVKYISLEMRSVFHEAFVCVWREGCVNYVETLPIIYPFQ